MKSKKKIIAITTIKKNKDKQNQHKITDKESKLTLMPYRLETLRQEIILQTQSKPWTSQHQKMPKIFKRNNYSETERLPNLPKPTTIRPKTPKINK